MRKFFLSLSFFGLLCVIGSSAFANISMTNNCNIARTFKISCLTSSSCKNPGTTTFRLDPNSSKRNFGVCKAGCGTGGTLVIDVPAESGRNGLNDTEEDWNNHGYIFKCDFLNPNITQVDNL